MGEPGVNVLELNLRPATGQLPGHDARTVTTQEGRARGTRTAADLPRAPPPASARPTRCSRRATAAPSAAPTCVVGFVETHGRPRTEAMLDGLEVVPRTADRPTGAPTFTEMDVDAVLARRPEVALVDELAHTNVPGSPQRQALAGRRGAARRRHRRALHGQHPAPGVAQRRRRADHRRAAAGDRARRGGPPRRPDRAGRHDPRGAAPPDGARQHLPARQGRRRARQLLPASATSPRCASWPCCGWPTRSTSSSTATAPSTASTPPGRPASGSSSRSPAARRATP